MDNRDSVEFDEKYLWKRLRGFAILLLHERYRRLRQTS
jgi:hypothetical protein